MTVLRFRFSLSTSHPGRWWWSFLSWRHTARNLLSPSPTSLPTSHTHAWCTHKHTYTHTCTHIHTHMYTHMYAHIHAHAHTYTDIHRYIHIHTHVTQALSAPLLHVIVMRSICICPFSFLPPRSHFLHFFSLSLRPPELIPLQIHIFHCHASGFEGGSERKRCFTDHLHPLLGCISRDKQPLKVDKAVFSSLSPATQFVHS